MTMTRKQIARTAARRRVSSLVGNRQTLASLVRELQAPETADVCLHFSINWRALTPDPTDGRLHATCACGAHVTRSAFVN
jgi:hypothetical protein